MALALRQRLFLPERCTGLQIVHEKFGSLERRLPMRGRRHDEHDVVAGLQLAVSVDDERRLQRPASYALAIPAC